MGCLFIAGECKLVQPLWKMWTTHSKIPHPLTTLGIYSLEAGTHTYTLRDMHKNICGKINWKEPEAEINVYRQNRQAQCDVDTTEYYSAQKKRMNYHQTP